VVGVIKHSNTKKDNVNYTVFFQQNNNNLIKEAFIKQQIKWSLNVNKKEKKDWNYFLL